jgi:tetratricopeptide (TPR) repeat protein
MNCQKMKNQLRFPFTAYCLLLLLTASCRDFLEPRSQSEFIPETVDQLNELVVSAIPDPSAGMNLTCGFLDIVSDDVETLTRFFDQRQPTDVWYAQPYVSAIYSLYTWRSDYDVYMRTNGYYDTECYSGVYKKLVYVNAPLDYIDQVSGDAAMKNYVMAQAYTLRAFYYLHLVNVYGVPYTLDPGGPGVPLRTTASKENRKMTRNTVGEIYSLIVDDLRNAVALFEKLEPSRRYRQFRPTLPMALLLLSRAYLYMGDWENAAFYSQKLIDDWKHQFRINDLNALIADGYSNVHSAANSSSSAEVKCTQKFYPGFLTYSNPDVIWLYSTAEDITQLTAKEMSHGSSSRLQNNSTYATLVHASPTLIDSYDAQDLRLRTYLVRDLFNEPDYSSATTPLTTGRYRAYGKLQISDDGSGIPSSGNHFLPVTDSRTYGQALRFTEAYLILAESQAELGNAGDAKNTLEEIWKNRFASRIAPPSYTSGDVAELVRKERRRELCFEALRWFDLRRQGRVPVTHVWRELTYGDQQTYTLEQNDPGYTFPMPETVLLANPDLTQVELRTKN